MAIRTDRRPPDWLARAIVAGFAGQSFGAVVFVASLVAAGPIGQVYRGSSVLAQWMFDLTHNALFDLGLGSVYGLLALNLALGLVWAIVYGQVFEPRLKDHLPWQAGALFSLLPFFFSAVVLLPLAGAGLFGSALGGGPVPLFGSLILHLVYGSTMGAVYGPGFDRSESPGRTQAEVTRGRLTLGRAEQRAATGVVAGALVGGIAGLLLGALLPISALDRLLANLQLVLAVAGSFTGAAVGAVVGSLGGLTDPTPVPVVEAGPGGAQPLASALIPLLVVPCVIMVIVSIGSALLTVGNTHEFGKREAYDHAIILGLSLLAIVTFGAAFLSRGGSTSSGDGH